jgi:hypothetical protein
MPGDYRIPIILLYNFASPIILNTFAAIAEAMAKAIIDRKSNGHGIRPYSSMDRTEVS